MSADDVKVGLRQAYRRLLKPLVRILIRNGVTAAEMSEIVRQVFVDAAQDEEFHLPGRKQSDMRVSILTGLTRKEVHKFRRKKETKLLPSNLSRVSRVISGWNQDPEFTGPYGLPIPLPFEDIVGKPSFTELVRRHSGDMSPRAMLDELIRVGVVNRDEDELIQVTGRAYIPTQLEPASIERLGRVVGRLADTLDLNTQLENPEEGRFERQVVTDVGLTDAEYEEFGLFVRKKAQELLVTLDDWLGSQEGRITTPNKMESVPKDDLDEDKIITGVAIFHFVDEKSPID